SLQTGSERIHKRVFDRPYDRELFLRTIRKCRSLGVVFYTDVITFNPYEQESDLDKTLDVLLQVRGPLGLCINKLFVLPGTSLAGQMRRDGMPPEDGSRDRLFGYYCRLFSIASLSPFSGWIARLAQRFDIFRRRPALLHMPTLEFGFRVVNALHRRGMLLRNRLRPRKPDPPPATSEVHSKEVDQNLVQIQ